MYPPYKNAELYSREIIRGVRGGINRGGTGLLSAVDRGGKGVVVCGGSVEQERGRSPELESGDGDWTVCGGGAEMDRGPTSRAQRGTGPGFLRPVGGPPYLALELAETQAARGAWIAWGRGAERG